MEPLKQELKPLTKVVSEWVHEYFKKTDLDISEEGNRATYEFTGEDSGDFNYKGYVEVYEERAAVEVYLYAPVGVPGRRRKEVAELLARINYGLSVGQIGLNFESGKIRYKGTIEVKDGALSVAMVNIMVDRGMSILDNFLPAVNAVAYTNDSPADAFAKVDDDAPKKEKASLPDAESLKDVWPWDRFVGIAPIQAWASDLQRAVEAKADIDAWALAGRAVVIVNSDEAYCREALRCVAATSGMKFVPIPVSEVLELSPPSAFRSMAPLLVYLEPGRWMQAEGDEDESAEDAERVEQFQSQLVDGLRDFNPGRPVVFAVSAIKLDDVSERLRQVGLFERFMTLPQRSLEMVGMDFIDKLGRERCGASMLDSPGKVGKLISWSFGQLEQRDLALLSMKRIHVREKRLLEFLDLVHITTHDLLEEGIPQPVQEAVRRQTAYHEAGHAVVSVLETGGKDVPDYTSIVPGASGFGGITVESYGFYYAKGDDQTTYQDFRQKVRIGLGGRAAEELSVGAENISNGASGDLESATKSAWSAFAHWGFTPSMEDPGRSESNLAVVFGKATDSEFAHFEKLIRDFLATEYRVVREMLTANRALLDDVAERLMWDPVVDQDELTAICAKHDVATLGSN